jgi:hypothetical protein
MRGYIMSESNVMSKRPKQVNLLFPHIDPKDANTMNWPISLISPNETLL